MPYTILIIEDEPDINRLLARILKTAGYEVRAAFSGTEARLLLEKEMPDLILLDLMLPGLSGEELLAEIRGTENYSTENRSAGIHNIQNHNTEILSAEMRSPGIRSTEIHGTTAPSPIYNPTIPILILSAKNSLQDKVFLLRSGADDYITKPFEPEEVLARVEAGLRRCGKALSASQGADEFVHGELKIYPSARKVLLKNHELTLTVHEFDILLLLMQHPEKVYSRESLYEQVWQDGYYGENNTVNVHVSNLRRKLKDVDPDTEYIQTVYGIGFKLKT